jgi:hypothetical protein
MEIAQQNFESPSTAILGDVLQAVGQRMR